MLVFYHHLVIKIMFLHTFHCLEKAELIKFLIKKMDILIAHRALHSFETSSIHTLETLGSISRQAFNRFQVGLDCGCIHLFRNIHLFRKPWLARPSVVMLRP